MEEALNEILAQSGRHFDPHLVRLFLGLEHDVDAGTPGGAVERSAV